MSLRNISVLTVVLLACMPTLCQAESLQYANQVLADGAIGYWRLDDAAGQKTYVNSGSGGTALNGTSISNKVNATGLIVTNPSDTAALINGTETYDISGSGISTAAAGGTNVFANSWTLEGWFKLNAFNSLGTLFSNAAAGGGSPVLTFGDGGTGRPTTKLFLMNQQVSWGGAIGIDLSSALNKTTYAALTYDKTTNKASIYANVDGTWITLADQTVGWTLNKGDGFYIGRQAPSYGSINGTVDDVAIYATKLSYPTLQNHYTLATVAPEPGTLVLLGSALIGLLAYAWRKRN